MRWNAVHCPKVRLRCAKCLGEIGKELQRISSLAISSSLQKRLVSNLLNPNAGSLDQWALLACANGIKCFPCTVNTKHVSMFWNQFLRITLVMVMHHWSGFWQNSLGLKPKPSLARSPFFLVWNAWKHYNIRWNIWLICIILFFGLTWSGLIVEVHQTLHHGVHSCHNYS